MDDEDAFLYGVSEDAPQPAAAPAVTGTEKAALADFLNAPVDGGTEEEGSAKRSPKMKSKSC
ncbi:hypothetical protein BT69DRAFT_320621 [Atractiella rhizophila]|nr:hypothetical protein BT69DRAFT_320621 [Atractiella rhizophila]